MSKTAVKRVSNLIIEGFNSIVLMWRCVHVKLTLHEERVCLHRLQKTLSHSEKLNHLHHHVTVCCLALFLT